MGPIRGPKAISRRASKEARVGGLTWQPAPELSPSDLQLLTTPGAPGAGTFYHFWTAGVCNGTLEHAAPRVAPSARASSVPGPKRASCTNPVGDGAGSRLPGSLLVTRHCHMSLACVPCSMCLTLRATIPELHQPRGARPGWEVRPPGFWPQGRDGLLWGLGTSLPLRVSPSARRGDTNASGQSHPDTHASLGHGRVAWFQARGTPA